MVSVYILIMLENAQQNETRNSRRIIHRHINTIAANVSILVCVMQRIFLSVLHRENIDFLAQIQHFIVRQMVEDPILKLCE